MKYRIAPAHPVKIILILTAVILVFAGMFSAAASGERRSPADPVKELNAALLQAMKGGTQLGFDGRYALLKPVIDHVFALQTMTRICVGKQWQHFSPQQRKNLTGLYARWSAASYANNFNDYSGESFEIESARANGRRANVSSTLCKENGPKIMFLYKLVESDGEWRIVDIHIEGVSQLSMTRTQFVSILDRKGYEGLVQSLQKKIKDLGTGK